MWMFCCLALIVMLVLALWPDPDRVRTSYGIPDHQAGPGKRAPDLQDGDDLDVITSAPRIGKLVP
jgi:hypothetical protein